MIYLYSDNAVSSVGSVKVMLGSHVAAVCTHFHPSWTLSTAPLEFIRFEVEAGPFIQRIGNSESYSFTDYSGRLVSSGVIIYLPISCHSLRSGQVTASINLSCLSRLELGWAACKSVEDRAVQANRSRRHIGVYMTYACDLRWPVNPNPDVTWSIPLLDIDCHTPGIPTNWLAVYSYSSRSDRFVWAVGEGWGEGGGVL